MHRLYQFKRKDLTDRDHYLEIWAGDIISPEAGKAHLLVISAFPNTYFPMPGTIIARLDSIGVKVGEEAKNKQSDWRGSWHCWVSKPIRDCPQVGQLICFEHGSDPKPDKLVGNVFRSVREHLITGGGTGNCRADTLRLPLLATGVQNFDRSVMLQRLVEPAVLHLKAGLPVPTIQIFIYARSHEEVVKSAGLLVESGLTLANTTHDWLGVQAGTARPELDVFSVIAIWIRWWLISLSRS